MSKTKQQPPHKCFIDTTQKINDMGLIKIICQTIRLQYLSLVITETINLPFFYLGPLVIVSAVAFFLVLVLRLVENLLAAFLLFSFPNTLFFFQGKWRRAEELYTTAPRLHKSWPKAVAVTLHTIKRNSNSNVSNVRKTDRWIQLYYTVRYISYHQQRR